MCMYANEYAATLVVCMYERVRQLLSRLITTYKYHATYVSHCTRFVEQDPGAGGSTRRSSAAATRCYSYPGTDRRVPVDRRARPVLQPVPFRSM
jgi:hypothetical protein